jgi:hypothetical protein
MSSRKASSQTGGEKALSLSQPWAELVVSGQKVIETRKWRTSFRGHFFIHAAKKVDVLSMDDMGFDDALLPTGALVGSADLLAVREYPTWDAFEDDWELHKVRMPREDWTVQRFGFILAHPQRLPKPIPCAGMLNFWTVPDSILESLKPKSTQPPGSASA